MTDEPKFTLAEARAEMARQECAHGGHAPAYSVHTGVQSVASHYRCDCGRYRWTPTEVNA